MLQLKLRSLWNRRLNDDLQDELLSHIEEKAEALGADGMPREDALREARRLFGNLTRTVEGTRELHVFTGIESFVQDARYGLRRLWRERAFTSATMFTLGLVIGINGAIFSIVEAVLLRPLPFPQPDRLVEIYGTTKDSKRAEIHLGDVDRLGNARSLASISAEQVQSVALTGVAEPGRLIGGFVASSYFKTLDVTPTLGRSISAEDEKPGGPSICLLNYAVWRDQFGSDKSVLGRSLLLNNEAHTVVGVLPENFQPRYINAEVWMPVRHFPAYSRDGVRTPVFALARLAPGATIEQARAELGGRMRQLAEDYPATNRVNGVAVHALQEIVVGPRRIPMLVLSAGAAFVLLLGCANIAGLLLSKAANRRQEIAIRDSLGAGRGRLIRQLLTESLLLSVAGGVAGIVFANLGINVLRIYGPDLIALTEPHLNGAVLAYLAATSILTGILLGLAPAFSVGGQATKQLRQRGATGRRRFQNTLVVGQVALALVLLSGAGLLATSLHKIATIHPGFQVERMLTLEYRLAKEKYGTGRSQTSIHQQILARVATVPGVESTALVGALPFSGNANQILLALPDRRAPEAVSYNPVSPGYFRTAGVPLLAGRDFSMADGPDAQAVAVVSRAFADRYWPGQEPLGRQIHLSTGAGSFAPTTIVGVVGDVKQHALNGVAEPQVYRSYAQDPYLFATLVVRTRRNPMTLSKSVKQAIWSVEPQQAVWKVRTLEFVVERSYSYLRSMAWTTICFAALALLLSAIGLYGLLSYTVAQRTRELGIRMAIGASPGDAMRQVYAEGMTLIAIGLAVGISCALLLTKLLRSQLYGVTTTEPSVYAVVSLMLLMVASLAVWFPARRAMRLDPLEALRQE